VTPRDVAGALVMLGGGLLALAALRCARAGREPAALACVLLLALVLRAFPASDRYLHQWDESYHAVVARHLADHPGTPTLYEDPVLPYHRQAWPHTHVWLHKQPLALWTMAASLKAFGMNELALRLPSMVFSTLAVAMTWWLGRSIGGPLVGLSAAFLHAVSGPLITLAAGRGATDHVDTLFITLVEAGVVLAVKWRRPHGALPAVAVGAVVGLAALAKSPIAAVVLGVWWCLLRETASRRRALALVAVAGVVAALVFAPWQIHALRSWPVEARWERSYDLLHLTRTLEHHRGGPFFHVLRIPRYFGPFALVSLAWFALRVRRRDARAGDLYLERALWVWLLAPYVFFSFVATKMPAYVFIAAPALFLILGLHLPRLVELARSTIGWRRRAALAGVAVLVAFPIAGAVQAVKPIGGPPWRLPWIEQLKAAGRRFADLRIVAFNVPRPIDAMFYTSFVAYARMPRDADIVRCRERGYQVLVWNDGRLPASIRERADLLVWPPP